MASDFTLLTSSQAAQLLEVHESSVKRWTNEGALKPYWLALGGGGLRPDALDLKRAPFLGASAHRNIEALHDWARSKLRAEIARARPAPAPGASLRPRS